MSSYGSMSPSGETSPSFDRYEPQFFCAPTHFQGGLDSPMYWQGSNLEPAEYEQREVYHGNDTHYIGRSYGYEDMQLTPPGSDAYGDAYSQHQALMTQQNIQNNNMGYEDMQLTPPGSDAYGDAYTQQQALMTQQNIQNNNMVTECEYQHAAPSARPAPHTYVRVVKRRNTANKKERRRTQSINTAFSDLRDCIPNVPHDTKLSKERRRTQNVNSAFSDLRERIPNVPSDTKLSKIKTLRLATSYISYLMRVLECDSEPAGGFRAELHHAPPRRQRQQHTLPPTVRQEAVAGGEECKRSKGRTGWPQHVWALELKQEHQS